MGVMGTGSVVGGVVAATVVGALLLGGGSAPAQSAEGLALADTEVTEGAEVRYTIALSRAAERDVRVLWETRDASARGGVDYGSTSGSAIIPAGQTELPSGPLTIPAYADAELEPAEELFLQVSAEGIGDGRARIIIHNAPHRAAVEQLEGRVLVRRPNTKRFVPLTDTRDVPSGALVDARRGEVGLTVPGAGGDTQTAAFEGGAFRLRLPKTSAQTGQRSSRTPAAELSLASLSKRAFAERCSTRSRGRRSALPAAGQDVSAARHTRRSSRRRVRTIRGKTRSGRFRVRGRYAAATQRGTVWTVTDRCDGTLIQVRSGSVTVQDLRRGTRKVVRAGKSLLVRAPHRRAR